MSTTRMIFALLLVTSATALSCSKDKSPTTPGGGTTVEPFESGTLGPGASFLHTFTTAGTYAYHCRIHSGMTGTVIVAPGPNDSVVVNTSGMTFVSSTVSVNPGGYVRWQISGTSHTVSRP
jgi:plastocyanin